MKKYIFSVDQSLGKLLKTLPGIQTKYYDTPKLIFSIRDAYLPVKERKDIEVCIDSKGHDEDDEDDRDGLKKALEDQGNTCRLPFDEETNGQRHHQADDQHGNVLVGQFGVVTV